jgi:hypothetical protein
MPAPVQPAERVLHHVLGGSPVTEHDDGQPDQAERVGLVQCGHGAAGVWSIQGSALTGRGGRLARRLAHIH